MSSVELHLETNLGTTDRDQKPGLYLSYRRELAPEGTIILASRFSSLQKDDDPAIAFLRASARNGIISVSVSTSEIFELGPAEKLGSITFQINKSEKYHIINAHIPEADFRLLAAIISNSKRPLYPGGYVVGATFERAFSWLSREKPLWMTIDFEHDAKAFADWVESANETGSQSRKVNLTFIKFVLP